MSTSSWRSSDSCCGCSGARGPASAADRPGGRDREGAVHSGPPTAASPCQGHEHCAPNRDILPRISGYDGRGVVSVYALPRGLCTARHCCPLRRVWSAAPPVPRSLRLIVMPSSVSLAARGARGFPCVPSHRDSGLRCATSDVPFTAPRPRSVMLAPLCPWPHIAGILPFIRSRCEKICAAAGVTLFCVSDSAYCERVPFVRLNQ